MVIRSKANSCFLVYQPNPQARLRLFCFPYAGGGPHVYRAWADQLPHSIEVCAAQFPGRGGRLLEPPFTKVEQFVEESAQALLRYSDKPFAFFGHSMGALISFELARLLNRENRLLPLHLFVSGRGSPERLKAKLRISQLPEAELLEELGRFEGTPDEVLKNSELMSMMLPSIRADFLACESYSYSTEPALPCPISVFAGSQDREMSHEQIEEWRNETTASFSRKLFPGGHFYLNTAQPLLLQELVQTLLSPQLQSVKGSFAINPDETRLHHIIEAEPPSRSASEEEVIPLPPHLIALPGGEWRLWRWAGLRGTGFPVSHVLQLSAPDCASAADELLNAEDEFQQNRDRALINVREALDALRQDNNWEDAEKRKPLVSALRALTKGKLPSPAQVADEIKPSLEAAHAADDKRAAAGLRFQRAFADESIKLSQAFHEIASMERFQEAIIWQNRQAFHSAIVPLLKQTPESGPGNSRQRQHKELIANYLQRYCAKNDTIGFFGPVGWARLVSQGEALTARPGPGLLATRNVYFESWCIDALAETLNKNKALRPWVAPRPVPYIHLEGTMLCLPLARPVRLSPQQAAALQLCDGARTAKTIAVILMQTFPSVMKSEAETYNLLEQFSARGLILWKLELPTGLFPERALRRLLEGIADEGLRHSALEPLDELERGRDAVVRAVGNPGKLDDALADLENSFTRLSDEASTRSAGKMYAARTLVYEDCRRDIEVEVGPELLQKLGPPLSLLLTSARWFTFQVAEFYRKIFKEIYRDLARLNRSPAVDGATFWYRVQPRIFDQDKLGSTAILPDFQERWADVLSIPGGQRRYSYSAEQLRARVQESFAAPGAGWTSARHHSPDIMIAASSAEAVRRGEYLFVLGEFHLGVNTLRGSLFVAQHPRPEDIFRAIELDMPEHAVRITPPKTWSGLTSRTTPILLPSENFRLMVTHDSICDAGAQALPIGSLVIEERGGELLVRSRDGSLSFDIIEAFADILSNQMVNKLKILRAGGHLPRITLDNLVVSRESWTFASAELSFGYIKDDAERFLAIRRWAGAHEIPRFVFIKSPIEVKPFYVDFESPVYTDIFAKIVRRTKESAGPESLIAISEMLPDHTQTWLSDAEGQRYTSEFRMVAVDSVN